MTDLELGRAEARFPNKFVANEEEGAICICVHSRMLHLAQRGCITYLTPQSPFARKGRKILQGLAENIALSYAAAPAPRNSMDKVKI